YPPAPPELELSGTSPQPARSGTVGRSSWTRRQRLVLTRVVVFVVAARVMLVPGCPVLVNLLRGMASVALWFSGVVLVCTEAESADLHMSGEQRRDRTLYAIGRAFFG